MPFIAADLGELFRGKRLRVAHQAWLGTRRSPKGGRDIWRNRRVAAGPDLTNLYVITMLFALATFSYAAFSTIANTLPSELFESGSVASVSGVSGTAAGIGTIVASELIGYYSDLCRTTATHVFDPIMVVAGLIPFCGMILVLLLVRNTSATRQGLVREI